MNRIITKKKILPFKRILTKTWSNSSDEDLDEITLHEDKVSKLVAVIQGLSYGETKEEIEEAMKKLNKKWKAFLEK